MTQQLHLGLALQGADEGIQRAAAGARAAIPNWPESALGFFASYVMNHRGQVFQVEDVRVWAEFKGLPRPPDSRAWGLIVKQAARLNMVSHAGYENQKSITCHGSPKAKWRAI